MSSPKCSLAYNVYTHALKEYFGINCKSLDLKTLLSKYVIYYD